MRLENKTRNRLHYSKAYFNLGVVKKWYVTPPDISVYGVDISTKKEKNGKNEELIKLVCSTGILLVDLEK